jgi:hypothetical protein
VGEQDARFRGRERRHFSLLCHSGVVLSGDRVGDGQIKRFPVRASDRTIVSLDY